jgi:hypothetical protein
MLLGGCALPWLDRSTPGEALVGSKQIYYSS